MAPVEYSSIRKDIMTPMECTQMVYRPNEHGMVFWKTVFCEEVIVMVKVKRKQSKRYNVIKN